MQNNKPTIGIIGGRGKMGQWLKNFFTSHAIPVLISGRNTPITIEQLIKTSNIVIVSVPISATTDVLKKAAKLMPKTSLLADITSVKVMPLDAMEEAKSGTLGMHLLFGPTIGVFPGQTIVFCRQNDNKYVFFLKDLFEKSGITVIEMSAEEHDYQMAYIQALNHAMHLLFAKTIFEDTNALSTKLYTPTFSLQALIMGRILQQDLELMADIELENPYFLPILASLLEKGKQLLQVVQKHQKDKFITMFQTEKKFADNFANFSTYQTNKILQLANDTPTSIPQKTKEQKKLSGKIACLGPEGTYSQQAVERIFSHNAKPVFSETLYEVFNLVHTKDVAFGVVPAENSIEGTVRGTLDYLVDFSLYVAGSFEIPIHQQLLSLEKNLSKIKFVSSHPQAISQCKIWLRNNLPHARIIPSTSTTAAMQNPKKEHAYIGSSLAAKLYDLSILVRDIEDNKLNTTKFYVIAKHPLPLKELQTKKTLLFLTVYNRVGVLRDLLDVFAKHRINLTMLESRPSREKLWDYHFFAELEKEVQDKQLSTALKELEKYCPVIRVLGQT